MELYIKFFFFISLRPLSTRAKTKIRKCAEFCSLTKSCAGMIFLPSYCLFQSFITSIFKFSVGAATRKAAVIATKHRRIRSSLTGKFHHTLLLTVERPFPEDEKMRLGLHYIVVWALIEFLCVLGRISICHLSDQLDVSSPSKLAL